MLNLIQHPLQKEKPYNKHEIPNQVQSDDVLKLQGSKHNGQYLATF